MHPIVRQLDPSDEQTPPITSRGSDVVVTAGAGTGKTRTLVARYLSLLAEGLHPNEIAAITFTRKAAREMRNRVRGAISDYLHSDLDSLDERNMWTDRYAELDSARIGTIHSLCTEILRAHPAEAGIDPQFTVLEEAESAILRSQAVNDALAWTADQDEVVWLFRTFSERGLHELLQLLLSERLEASAAFGRGPQEYLDDWQNTLHRRQVQAVESILSHPTWREAQRTLRENVASKPDDSAEVQRRMAVSVLEAAHNARDWPAQREALADLDQIDLRGGSKYAWPHGKPQQAAVKAALRNLRELWRQEAGFLLLELNEADEALAEALPGLEAVFHRALETYERLQQERRALDFDDLERRALALLSGNAPVRERWHREIGAVLVDEYQDTNARQRDLVALLTGDEGRLFIVGDAKQSIYRFRGADVTVFRQERKRIAERGAQFALQTSYRAHKALIDGLNQLLRPVLGSEDDSTVPWREPFQPLAHHRERPSQGIEAPFVELHLTVGSKAGGALERAAEALAARLVELVEDADTEVGYGDVAILCRSSSSFSAYEDALDGAGVPYLTVAGRGFYERPEVRDLLNALQVIADPGNDLWLVGLLRSPIVGLSDSDLLHLIWQQRAGGHDTLWELLLDRADAGGPDEYTRVVSLLAQLKRNAGRSTIADTLKALLDETGYRAALKQAGQTRAALNVGKLLEVARGSGIVDTTELLEYVSTVRDVAAREGEARSAGEEALQIMSVHQAKGLEFPVVVIGDANYDQRRTPNTLLDPELGITTRLNREEEDTPAVLEMVRRREASQEAAEAARLLYVAATRAEELLIFSGTMGLRKDGQPSRLSGWLGEVAETVGLSRYRFDDYLPDGQRALELPLDAGELPARCIVYEPGFQARRVAQAPGRRETFSSSQLDPGDLMGPLVPAPEGEEGQEETSWDYSKATRDARRRQILIGKLVHEAIAGGALKQGWDGPALASWVASQARAHQPGNPPWVEPAVEDTLLLLERLRGDNLWHEILAAERRLHEIPYVIQDGDSYDSGRIDLLYRHEGRWTVVDFKTEPVGTREELRELMNGKFGRQLARYRRAVRALLDVRPHCVICLLDYRGNIHVQSMPGTERGA